MLREEVTLEVGEMFFGEMARREAKSPGEILIVARRPGNRVLLMTKAFYPGGIYRLPTGKMKRGESADDAAKRETFEELGYDPESHEPLGVIECMFTYADCTAAFLSYAYLLPETDVPPHPLDTDEQITDFREVDMSELPAIADRLRELEDPWMDWGRWRAIAHQVVYKWLSG